MSHATKLRHRLAAVSGGGAPMLRQYHRTWRTGGAARVQCHRRCAFRPNTSLRQPLVHSSQLSGASESLAMPKHEAMKIVTGMQMAMEICAGW